MQCLPCLCVGAGLSPSASKIEIIPLPSWWLTDVFEAQERKKKKKKKTLTLYTMNGEVGGWRCGNKHAPKYLQPTMARPSPPGKKGGSKAFYHNLQSRQTWPVSRNDNEAKRHEAPDTIMQRTTAQATWHAMFSSNKGGGQDGVAMLSRLACAKNGIENSFPFTMHGNMSRTKFPRAKFLYRWTDFHLPFQQWALHFWHKQY